MASEKILPFPPPADVAEPGDDEFVFRFRLDAAAVEAGAHPDPLVELVRGELADLLRCAVLTYRGKRVRVDGFQLLRDPETQHAIFGDVPARMPAGSDGGPEPAP
jgi:hypothetical protein